MLSAYKASRENVSTRTRARAASSARVIDRSARAASQSRIKVTGRGGGVSFHYLAIISLAFLAVLARSAPVEPFAPLIDRCSEGTLVKDSEGSLFPLQEKHPCPPVFTRVRRRIGDGENTDNAGAPRRTTHSTYVHALCVLVNNE